MSLNAINYFSSSRRFLIVLFACWMLHSQQHLMQPLHLAVPASFLEEYPGTKFNDKMNMQ